MEEKESSTSSEAPIPTPEPFVSPTYKPEDFEQIRTLYTEVKEWLDGKLAAQAKLSKTDDPAFEAKEVVAKTKTLNDTLMIILQRQIRNADRAKAKAKATSTPKVKKAKKAKTSSSSAAGEESSTVTFEVPTEEATGASETKSVRDEL